MVNGQNNNITKYLNRNSIIKYNKERVEHIKADIKNQLKNLFQDCPNRFTPEVKVINDKEMVVISIGENIPNNRLDSEIQRIDLIHAVIRFKSIMNESRGIAHINIHFNDNASNRNANNENSFCNVKIPTYPPIGNSKYYKSKINEMYVVKTSITNNTNKNGEFIVNKQTRINKEPTTKLSKSLIDIMLNIINNPKFFPRK